MNRLKHMVIMLVALVVGVLLPTEAKADYTSGDWTYKVYGNEATITEYNGNEIVVTVPEKIDGNIVVAIGYEAFSGNDKLVSVQLPSSITSIGGYAFYNCVQLKEITMENAANLKTIGSYAFYYCKALEKIVMPEKLESVGYKAFYGTEHLAEITVKSKILNNFESSGNTFFNVGKEASNGTKVIFSDTVTRIPAYMFYNSSSNYTDYLRLNYAFVGKNVTEVGERAFANCSDLTTVIFADDSTMKTIGSYAFSNCEKLTVVILPSSVANVNYNAFYGCSALSALTLHSITSKIYASEATMGSADVTVLYGLYGSTLQNYAERYGYQFVGNCNHDAKILDAVEATCEETGLTEGSRCSLCGELLVAQEIVPAIGHNEVVLQGYEANCVQDGLSDGSKCSLCSKILKAQETIPATGHKDADHDQTCDHCGLVLACEHLNTGIIVGKPATCEEDGLTEGLKCNDCGEIIETQGRIPAKGHDYESKEDPAATCTESGKLVYTCKNDPSHSYEIETPAKGHNFHKGECVVCGAFDDFVNPFIDVKETDWFYQSVIWAVRNDVTGGTSSVTFSPNDGCTRAQVVTFLWAANGKPEPTSKSNPFKDVKSTDWFYKPVLWAVENGITGGVSANEFGPNQTCTRAQIVTFLYAAEGKPYVSGSSTFADVKNDDWFAKPVIWAAKYDVTGGIGDGKFGPNNTCTRAQVVTFLYKADQVDRDSYEEEPAPELDDDAIYAAFLNKRGYMTEWNKEGLSEMYPPNEFIPDGQYHPVGFCQIDIDQNGLDELVIVSDGYYVEFVAFLVFTIDEDTGEVVRLPLLDEYGSNTLLSYGGVEYSPANMALVITPTKAMGGDGSSHDYYMIAEERMTCVEPPDGIYDCELLKEKALP